MLCFCDVASAKLVRKHAVCCCCCCLLLLLPCCWAALAVVCPCRRLLCCCRCSLLVAVACRCRRHLRAATALLLLLLLLLLLVGCCGWQWAAVALLLLCWLRAGLLAVLVVWQWVQAHLAAGVLLCCCLCGCPGRLVVGVGACSVVAAVAACLWLWWPLTVLEKEMAVGAYCQSCWCRCVLLLSLVWILSATWYCSYSRHVLGLC